PVPAWVLSRYSSFLPQSKNMQTGGKMIPQRAQVVLSLDAEEVGSLQEGVNFKKNPQDGKCYIIYKNGDLRACRNQCKHQGGLFIKDIEDLDGR
uniref:Rieske domain-containing protein n=1 Tax=Mola mola TaxID=94237 RepID=A0A3Q3WKW5_MOLML